MNRPSENGLSERPIMAAHSQALHARAAWFVQRNLGIGPTELVSQRRHAHLVVARALFVCCVRWSSELASYPLIGRWLHRDHSTIIALKRKADALLEREAEFRAIFDRWQSEERLRQEVPHACA